MEVFFLKEFDGLSVGGLGEILIVVVMGWVYWVIEGLYFLFVGYWMMYILLFLVYWMNLLVLWGWGQYSCWLGLCWYGLLIFDYVFVRVKIKSIGKIIISLKIKYIVICIMNIILFNINIIILLYIIIFVNLSKYYEIKIIK